MEISKYIGQLTNLNIKEVSIYVEGGKNIPYTIDGKMYTPRGVNEGYIREKNGQIVDKSEGNISILKSISNYRLVFFVSKSTCDADIKNIIFNCETSRRDMKKEIPIKVTEYFLDTIKNVNQEFKTSLFPDYKVIIADLEVEENFCVSKICQ